MTNAQNNVKYATFNLFKLFDEKVQRGTRLVKAKRIPGNIPLVTAGEANRGVAAWIKHNKVLFPANSLTIDMFGNVFYRDQPFFADDNILVLASDGKYSDKVMLYMSAQIRTALQDRFNYGHQFRQKSLRSVIISLPVTPSDTPDFEYMEERIRELEKERIRELEAYLKVTGLSDATLTKAEQAALDKMNMGGVKWKKFKIDTILDKPIAGNVDIQRKDISNNGEFVVTSGLTNYGIQGHTTKFANIVKDPSLTIDMFGNVFYRDEPYKLVTHGRVYGFTSKLIKSRETGLFLATVLHPLHEKFSYNNMFTWNKIKNLEIALPVTSSGDIDFDFIENYITAIEKQSICGVIEYKDKVIQTTKNMVNAN